MADGGFEAPIRADFRVYEVLPGEVDICYWSVTSGSVYVITSSYWYAQEGSQSLLLGGDGNVTAISQAMATIPGKNYSIDFFLSANPQPCIPMVKMIEVQITSSDNSSAVKQWTISVNSSGLSDTNMKWQLVSLYFVAEKQMTILSFINYMKAETCAPVIDNVVVKESKASYTQPKVQRKIHGKRILVGVSIAAVGVLTAVITVVVMKSRERASKKDACHSKNINASNSTASRKVETFTLLQLERATKNFTTKVGEGGFGTVYRANLRGGVEGAVKRARKRQGNHQAWFMEELSLLLRIHHPFLVNLLGFCAERGEQILVFEFARNGSLFERLHRIPSKSNERVGPVLAWAKRMAIVYQVACALEYLHELASPAILHCDVKSSNILLIQDDSAKLADFGISRFSRKDHSTFTGVKGSHGYIDPYYVKTGRVSEKSDVYSYGVVLMEVVTGKRSLQGSQTLTEWSLEHRQSLDGMLSIVDGMLCNCINVDELETIRVVANLCLGEEPTNRPSMSEVVRLLHTRLSTSLVSVQMAVDHPMPCNGDPATHVAPTPVILDDSTALSPR